jgi:competence protein ComEC
MGGGSPARCDGGGDRPRAAATFRISLGVGCRRPGGWVGDRHHQARDHRTPRAVGAGLERRYRGLRRDPGRARAPDRIVVRIERIAGPRLDETLERVRVSVRKGTAPAVGTFVEFKARLSPPLEPLRPGGYDFARDMYFNRIGASGFVLGRIRVAEMPHAPSLWLRYATVVDGMREAIDQRIRAVLPGDKGAIASAVITGKRDAITPPVNEAMYVSGLAHVLSISGYHMAVVAGMIFFAVRAVFALLPAFSNRRPIKKCVTAVEMS